MKRCSVYSKKDQNAMPSTNTPATASTERSLALIATDSRNEITGM